MEEMAEKYVQEIVRAMRLSEGHEGPFTVTKWSLVAEVESMDDEKCVLTHHGEHTASWDVAAHAWVLQEEANTSRRTA